MTDEAPKKRNRVRRYGLMMSDVEIFDALGLPEEVGRKAFRQLDKPIRGLRPFPQPVPLFGNRRFWPAVERYFMEEFGGIKPDFTPKQDGSPSWKENFDEAKNTQRSVGARPRLAASN